MLFRVHIAVLRTVSDWRSTPNGPYRGVYDTVVYTFGINAEDAAEAGRVAARAAENAFDRDGQFLGGVVIEIRTMSVGPEEFDGMEDYLLQPVDQAGIFYVTGTTHSAVTENEVLGALEELELLRQQVRSHGLPPPSFVHPQLQNTAPRRVRIFCPVCGRWTEVDNTSLLYSFFDGLADALAFDEFEEATEAGQLASAFIRRHFECLQLQTDHVALRFLYESGDEYAALDESKREVL